MTGYLRDMEVPERYADVMFSTPSNQAVFIPYTEMRDKIAGYPMATEEWLMAKCRVSSTGQNQAVLDKLSGKIDTNKFEEWATQQDARIDCILKALEDKRRKIYYDTHALNTGELAEPSPKERGEKHEDRSNQLGGQK